MVIPIIPKTREKQNQTINALEKLNRAKKTKLHKTKGGFKLAGSIFMDGEYVVKNFYKDFRLAEMPESNNRMKKDQSVDNV